MTRGDKQGALFLGGMLLLVALIIFAGRPATDGVDLSPVEIPDATFALVEQATEQVTFSFKIDRPGFVSLHEAMGPAPGEPIGQASVKRGDVMTTLPTNGYVGPMIALLFVDDGDGKLVYGKDRTVTANGQPLRIELNSSSEDDL